MLKAIVLLLVIYSVSAGADQKKYEMRQELVDFLNSMGVYYLKEDGSDPVPELLDCLAHIESGKSAEDVIHHANICMEKKGFTVEFLRHQS